ncbi:hypothetical protein SALBM135S_02834 [Streptomyces alboniger]
MKYAEKISGEPLAELFDTWLYQPSRPAAPAAKDAGLARSAAAPAEPRSWKEIAATNTVHDHGHDHGHGHGHGH